MGEGRRNDQPLFLHWDGASWTVVPGPQTTLLAGMFGVAALSHNDVWAVGSEGGAPLVEQWDGREWRIVPSPNLSVAAPDGALRSVVTISPGDAWAVGGTDPDTQEPIIMHWDGIQWGLVQGAFAQADQNKGLSSLAAVKAGAGVGASSNSGANDDLLIVWSSWPGSDAKVHLYSISKGTTTIISGPDAAYPLIDGDRVARVIEPNGGYTGGVAANWQVQEYNLKSGTTATLFNLDADFGLDALIEHSGRLALAYRIGSPYRTLCPVGLGALR